MTAIGETIAAINALIQQLQHSATAASVAASQAEKARTMAAAVGHTGTVAALGAIQQGIGEIHRAIGPLVVRAQEAINQAKAAEGG
jgi:hypothetical protein